MSNNAAFDLVCKYADKAGWTSEIVLLILCEYLNEYDNLDMLDNHLQKTFQQELRYYGR